VFEGEFKIIRACWMDGGKGGVEGKHALFIRLAQTGAGGFITVGGALDEPSRRKIVTLKDERRKGQERMEMESTFSLPC